MDMSLSFLALANEVVDVFQVLNAGLVHQALQRGQLRQQIRSSQAGPHECSNGRAKCCGFLRSQLTFVLGFLGSSPVEVG